jgi:glycine/D-amino acid oxidase-like deaminating enzyme
MLGENLRMGGEPGTVQTFGESDVHFRPDALVVESGVVARRLLAPNIDTSRTYDVIVVGSGIGGGVLADELSDRGRQVLVLEAGSYLFPTHVANLPREHLVGRFDKHVWSLWRYFRTENYTNVGPDTYRGGQGLNFGGRSIFWGGLTPRMMPWELDRWPGEVADYLLQGGYRMAEEALSARAMLPSEYQKQIKLILQQALPECTHDDAAVAVQYSGFTGSAIPAGMFSTADILLESALTGRAQGTNALTINLNHQVIGLETSGAKVTGVVARDLIAQQERTYRGKAIVLAAGTLETPRLVKRSGLSSPADNVGVGLTDHPIFYAHFLIPNGSPLYRQDATSKTMSRFQGAGEDSHPYNILLELGADFNQGRYLDPDILREHEQRKHEQTLCELVFLFHSPLVEENRVDLQGRP